MSRTTHNDIEPDRFEFTEQPRYRFSLSRRTFIESIGAGLLLIACAEYSDAQEPSTTSTAPGRFTLDTDGHITVYTGKVEFGQGARTQIAMAAAEELGLPLSAMRVVMADTALVPDDGGTYGSQTTPRTLPKVRAAATTAKTLLIAAMCAQLGIDSTEATFAEGVLSHADGKRLTLGEFAAKATGFNASLSSANGAEVALTPEADWKVLGKSAHRLNASEVVTGAHRYVSDIRRDGMLYGAVLRPPSFGAELAELDLKPALAMPGVVAVHDGQFAGCAAPTSYLARKAVEAIAATATWKTVQHPASTELFAHLKRTARTDSRRGREEGDVDAARKAATTVLEAVYEVPYIQHAPMETRSAVAEWIGDTLTVWTGTQLPFDGRDDVADAFNIDPAKVRLIVPDTGGGFGGKHQPDAAIEAARLAKAAQRPVSLQWSREEEFSWAYFRPAALIEIAAAIDPEGKLVSWEFTNYNAGTSGLASPYVIPNVRERYLACDSPLRQGSYRALASTANNFAREAFIDELAAHAKRDPLEFRNAHLPEGRLKAVLNAAAKQFDWPARSANTTPEKSCGIACGTEKGSYVATCAEIVIDPGKKSFAITHLTVAYDCGPVLNPQNLRAQVVGGIVMGLGAALRETITFENGKILNGRFKAYEVPRFTDLPTIDVVFTPSPDSQPAGAGETPMIAVAPALANALRRATAQAQRKLPLVLV